MSLLTACPSGLGQSTLDLKCYWDGFMFNSHACHIIRVGIINARTLRLISQIGKMVWRCPLWSVTVAGVWHLNVIEAGYLLNV